jgi:hypothetical protein
MRAKTERVQNESGTFDVPEELYERWTEHTAGVKNGGVV